MGFIFVKHNLTGQVPIKMNTQGDVFGLTSELPTLTQKSGDLASITQEPNKPFSNLE